MKPAGLIIFMALLLILAFPAKTEAAFSFQIDKISPETISSNEAEITVGLIITDLPSESYFRVAFQKSDGASYFGYLKNDAGNWVQTSENCSNFFHVTDKTTANLEIPLKVGDAQIESGTYNIKAHRYTMSCSNTPATNSIPLTIVMPTTEPTPSLPQPSPTLPPASPTQQPTMTPAELPTPIITPTVSYKKIFLSEVMVHPNPGEKEWVELYNDNDFPVNLANWYVDDVENGGVTPKKFSLDIPKKSYRTTTLPTNIFNDSGDSVRLLDYSQSLVDSFDYIGSSQGYSYGRINFDDNVFCLQTPSMESANNPCLETTDKPASPNKPTIVSPQTVVKKPPNKVSPTIIKLPSNRPSKIAGKNSADLQKTANVLGVSTKVGGQKILIIRFLSFMSLSYSLLTIIGILFKMKFIYEQGIRFLSSFIYSDGNQ